MKTKKDSSYYAYSALSIVFGMALAVTIYMIVAPLILSFYYSSFRNSAVLEVMLKDVVQSYDHQSDKFTIFGFEGTLVMHNPSGFQAMLGYLAPLWFFVPITYGIYLLRKIFENVYQKNHFAEENVKNMRIISLLVVLVPHLHANYLNIISSNIPYNLVINNWHVQRKTLGLINIFYVSVLPEYILYGLLIFVFSYVFVQGKKLQEENDLTV